MNLDIRTEEKEDYNLLHVSGEVDAYTASQLRESLLPLTEKEGASVIVDLSNVDYIDSTGLGIFIGALKSSNHYNGTLRLVGLNARVKRLFSITGLDEVMDIEEEEEAQ
ncbi:anti-sigma B factor antagonist [Salibacterium salarium]|uniref:Anti-sigma factor antagonist n=1 Tax=Salibacterium salarium TaxID=284579 RepID=A0A3R9QFG4_9BACI|nr:STAS domain-containing protein [Salibacterium salarium]MDQ0299928.1 anti-sigma B factor antagonist [Salibacterium salarium]RSL29418.1 anti-sigma factor antagonist [Salibacterium salarium]